MTSPLYNYKDILTALESTDDHCHLLLGNGFNSSLGINTSYKNIFTEMKKDYPEYSLQESFMENKSYDVELLINELKGTIERTHTQYEFLCKFIEAKVKFDFMKACYSIVKGELKKIYQEKNEGVHLLFKNFTNFFSLNYDPLLYLLLMNFKESDNKAIAFLNSASYIQEDLDTQQNDIYTEIQKARESGKIKTTIGKGDSSELDLKVVTKDYFQKVVKNHFKSKGWKTKDIEKVCDLIWEKEKGNKKIEGISDGFRQGIYTPDVLAPNIFFLHGAFHIYLSKDKILKITQTQNKAFYDKLEEVINADDEDIICVLTNKSEDKKEQINDNKYLKDSLEKLSQLDGSLVLFGSSLAENDNHIFEQINNSNISKIYITTNESSHSKDSETASKIFPNKEVSFFDYMTISYDKTNNEGESDE